MNRGKPAHGMMMNTGTFIGNAAFGSNNTVSNNTITAGEVQTSVSIDDLRKSIAAARDELVRAVEDPDAQAVVHHEIRAIEGELGKDQPRGPVVHSRWETVSEVLSPLAAASGIVTQITDMIIKVFSGS